MDGFGWGGILVDSGRVAGAKVLEIEEEKGLV